MTKANKALRAITKALSSPSSAISKPTALLWLLILAYILFFSTYTLQRHATFNTFAADLSFIDQPMWNTLHGRFLERTLDDRQVSRVAEHLEPIIIPIALVFYGWDDVRAILVVQTIALALGAVPIYWIAREQISTHRSPLGNSKSQITNSRFQTAAPLLFVIVYLMFPALQAANVADFHADPLVVTPLLFAFWYAMQGRYWIMWVWAIVAMLAKETLPTLTFMLGVYLFLGRGSDSLIPDLLFAPRRLHGLGLMAVSLIWFYVATFLIVAPLAREVYSTEGPIYLASRYAGLGQGSGGLLDRMANTLTVLREPDRLYYLAGLLASVGWLALLAPEYLLLGLPVLAANTFSNFPGQYSGEQHYSAPLAPVFVIAAIYGFRRLGGLASQHWRARRLGRYIPAALVIWLLAWCLGYHYLRGWTPLARDFDWPERTSHHRLLGRFIDQIPPGVPVSTTPPLHPHLAHREKIYVFPTIADAQFVLLDVAGRTDAHPNDVRGSFDALVGSGEFVIVDAADGYVLLSRWLGAGSKEQTPPDVFYDFGRVQDAKPQYPTLVEFDGRLRFLGYDVVDDPRRQQTHLRLYWQALAPLSDDPRLWPVIFDNTGDVIEDTSQRPMALPIWYPASQWRPGETIVTETLPWDLGPRFNVGLAVLRDATEGGELTGTLADFTDPIKRLPVTTADPEATLLHGNTWAQIGAFARHGHRLVPVEDDLDLAPLGVSFAEGIQLNRFQMPNPPGPPAGAGESPRPASHLCLPRAGTMQLKCRQDGQVSVVLEWGSAAPLSRDYTVFVHLVAPDGTIVAQSDAQPGWVVPWPTSRWLPDEPVLDGHRLQLPPDLSPGHYQVKAGLYDWKTLERLPVLDERMQPVADHVVLGEIHVSSRDVIIQHAQ